MFVFSPFSSEKKCLILFWGYFSSGELNHPISLHLEVMGLVLMFIIRKSLLAKAHSMSTSNTGIIIEIKNIS